MQFFMTDSIAHEGASAQQNKCRTIKGLAPFCINSMQSCYFLMSHITSRLLIRGLRAPHFLSYFRQRTQTSSLASSSASYTRQTLLLFSRGDSLITMLPILSLTQVAFSDSWLYISISAQSSKWIPVILALCMSVCTVELEAGNRSPQNECHRDKSHYIYGPRWTEGFKLLITET